MARKESLVVSGKVLIRSREERVDHESSLQIAIAKLLKATTGKGPKNIKVFIKKRSIEIDVLDSLTTYEKRLLINPSNRRLVRFSREAYYSDCIEDFKDIFRDALGDFKYRIEKISIDLDKGNDTIIISIE